MQLLQDRCASQTRVRGQHRDELRSDAGPDTARCLARPWPVHPAEPRFIGKHDPQPPTASGCRPPWPPYGAWEAAFLKSSWAARSRRG
jgi:hypothetical protein